MSVREPVDEIGLKTNIKKVTAPSFGGLMADMAKWGVVFAPPGDEGGGDPPEPAPEPEAKKADPKKKAADPAPTGPSEAEKALAVELKALKAAAAKLGSVTPEELTELRTLKADAEKLKAESESAKKKAEEEDLRKKGDFETLKQRMAEEHQKELVGQQTKAGELQALVDGLRTQVVGMALGSAFAASRFLLDETLLSPSKALKVYGDHFEVENGVMVPYDAPRGASKRTQLVDARGNPLAFDEAMKRIVEADPDRDLVLRAKTKPGTGQAPSGTRVPAPARPEPRGIDRIRAGLAELRNR